MARCSAAKATGNPETDFMASGPQNPRVEYGPLDSELPPALLEARA